MKTFSQSKMANAFGKDACDFTFAPSTCSAMNAFAQIMTHITDIADAVSVFAYCAFVFGLALCGIIIAALANATLVLLVAKPIIIAALLCAIIITERKIVKAKHKIGQSL